MSELVYSNKCEFLFLLYIMLYRVAKKAPYFIFHPKVVFYIFFSIFFRWCRQQAWEIILTPIWIQLDDLLRSNRQPAIIEAYFATKSVLLTVAMQERFWQGQCTWQKDSSKFGGQISGDRKCSRCPTKSTVVNIVQIVQIQQARVIFNPLTDIFTKCFSFCFILISLPPQDLNFVKKELKVIMEDPQNWCSQNASFFWKTKCWFSGEILMAFP